MNAQNEFNLVVNQQLSEDGNDFVKKLQDGEMSLLGIELSATHQKQLDFGLDEFNREIVEAMFFCKTWIETDTGIFFKFKNPITLMTMEEVKAQYLLFEEQFKHLKYRIGFEMVFWFDNKLGNKIKTVYFSKEPMTQLGLLQNVTVKAHLHSLFGERIGKNHTVNQWNQVESFIDKLEEILQRPIDHGLERIKPDEEVFYIEFDLAELINLERLVNVHA